MQTVLGLVIEMKTCIGVPRMNFVLTSDGQNKIIYFNSVCVLRQKTNRGLVHGYVRSESVYIVYYSTFTKGIFSCEKYCCKMCKDNVNNYCISSRTCRIKAGISE